MPKCFLCKKELDKNNCYTFVHESKSGKQYKRYYCSEEEFENDKRDKELYRSIQLITDEILGYPCINNTRNKKIKELQEAGYTNEQIYRCFKEYKSEIEYWINANGIDKEYNKIAYIFGVIKNCLYDFAREDEEKTSWEQYKKEEEEVEIEIEETEVPSNMKVKQRKKLF